MPRRASTVPAARSWPCASVCTRSSPASHTSSPRPRSVHVVAEIDAHVDRGARRLALAGVGGSGVLLRPTRVRARRSRRRRRAWAASSSRARKVLRSRAARPVNASLPPRSAALPLPVTTSLRSGRASTVKRSARQSSEASSKPVRASVPCALNDAVAAADRERFDAHFALREHRAAACRLSARRLPRAARARCARPSIGPVTSGSPSVPRTLQLRVHCAVEQHRGIDERRKRREPRDVDRRGESDGRSAGIARVRAVADRRHAAFARSRSRAPSAAAPRKVAPRARERRVERERLQSERNRALGAERDVARFARRPRSIPSSCGAFSIDQLPVSRSVPAIARRHARDGEQRPHRKIGETARRSKAGRARNRCAFT